MSLSRRRAAAERHSSAAGLQRIGPRQQRRQHPVGKDEGSRSGGPLIPYERTPPPLSFWYEYQNKGVTGIDRPM